MLALDDADLRNAVRRLAVDPAIAGRYRLDQVIERNFAALAKMAEMRPPLQFGYSVKTNPDRAFVAAARSAGLFAEVISPQELALALEFGFGTRTIYNGPWPAWRAGASPGIVFADSLQAFNENARRLPDALCGLRVRPARIESRFGVTREQLGEVIQAVRAAQRSRIAVSFHVRPEDYGDRSWRDIVQEVAAFGRELERNASARIVAFDAGGGRTPGDFDQGIAAGDLAWLAQTITTELSAVEAIYMEPGQAVATPCAVYVAPVLERRPGEAIVAAGYPEVSQIHAFPHRVLAIHADGEVEMLQTGADRILGRTCLEYDVIRNDVHLPSSMESVVAIVVADAGAYDSSMAFSFSLGGNKKRDDLGAPGR